MVDMKVIVMTVFGLYVAVILTSSLAPGALTGISVASINTTNWSAGLVSVFGSVSIMYGVAFLFLPIGIILRMMD